MAFFFFFFFNPDILSILLVFLNSVFSEARFQENAKKTINRDCTEAHVPHVCDCFQYQIVSSGLNTIAQSLKVLTQQNRKFMMQTLRLLVVKTNIGSVTHTMEIVRRGKAEGERAARGGPASVQWPRHWANPFPTALGELCNCGT